MLTKSNLYLIIILLGLTAASCSTTRRLPEGEQLYTGIKKIEYVTEAGGDSIAGVLNVAARDQIDEATFVKPNNYFKLLNWRYPFPLGLWVYNNWPNPKKGLRHWLYEKLVEEPVLVSDVRPQVRARMIDEILDNNGYFSGSATYDLIPGKNPRKAAVKYTITTGPAYRLHSVELLPDTTPVCSLINDIARRIPYLHAGSQYNADSLSAARIDIANAIRNKGYYYFSPVFLEYLADSINHPGSIDLRLVLGKNIPQRFIEPYTVGDVTVHILRNSRHGQSTDTISDGNITILRQLPMRLKPELITDNVSFSPGRIFTVRNMERTQTRLARYGIFNSVTINTLPDTINGNRRLNVDIECVIDKPLEASIEVNASSKSNSYIGPGITLGVTNRNIFGGGEQFSVKLTGAYEWQTGKDNKGGIFNSYEVSLTTGLAFPRLLLPKFVTRRRRNLNWTRITLNGDLLNRPHFFKMAEVNTGIAYDWQSSRNSTMSLTLFKLSYTKLMHTTQAFDSIMAQNPAVAQSFASQFIPQMQYNYNLNKPLGRDNSLGLSISAQQAGNIFWGIYELCGKHGEKKLFGTPFSQFVKGQVQLVWNRRLFKGDHWLVSRVAAGAAHAYGNSSQVPYAEQFYCGGANSVRAFTVRSIGPGSYRAPRNTPSDYFDQTGTFKFEANAEYRFPLFGPLHGAVFLDAGNVWLLKEDPQRPGGKLTGRDFFNDLALGTGVGLRVDISMLVLRGDLGIGIHAPYDTGKRGYYNMTSFGNSLAFHLAIGYPF